MAHIQALPSELVGPHDQVVLARVFDFATVLRAAGLMPPDEFDYFEKPWKWQPEYEAWLAAGCPTPPDYEVKISERTLASMRWERFVTNAEAAASP